MDRDGLVLEVLEFAVDREDGRVNRVRLSTWRLGVRMVKRVRPGCVRLCDGVTVRDDRVRGAGENRDRGELEKLLRAGCEARIPLERGADDREIDRVGRLAGLDRGARNEELGRDGDTCPDDRKPPRARCAGAAARDAPRDIPVEVLRFCATPVVDTASPTLTRAASSHPARFFQYMT